MAKKILMLLLLGLFPVLSVFASTNDSGCGEGRDHAGGDCASCHTLTVEEANSALTGLGVVKSVKHAAIKGLYEITLDNKGKQAIAYLDFAKKHLIPAPIFSLATKRPVGEAPTPTVKPKIDKVDVRALPVKDSVVLGNPAGQKRLFVFTDPDCPFCAKLHMELVKLVYMEPELAIYVKMFPLKMHPGAYDKARVILAGDSAYLLNKAFAGEQLPAATDKDAREPVDETIRLAGSLGISVTPTIILPDGTVVTGYREASALKKLIDGK